MGLEAFNFIDSLVNTNPVGATDPKSQGDDHLRGIKVVLLNSFPNFTGAMSLTHTQLNDAGLKSEANTWTALNGFAAITATSYDSILAANLVDKSAAEAITGGWTYDGILSTNLVDKSAVETISATWNFAAITATSYDGILATNLVGEISAIDTTVVNSDAAQPGYKGAPQRIIGASDSLVLTDMGKSIYLNAGSGQTLTIPANGSVAFPIGTIIPISNDSGNDWTIAITTDTVEKYGGATGSQTLGDNQKAVIEKVTATLWKYASTD